MKKPNITEGEWKYRYNGYYYDIEISGYSFITTTQNETLEFNRGLTKDVELANAKAISAVPEMIDALIEIYDELNNVENEYMQVSSDSFEIILKALKKAGCTD